MERVLVNLKSACAAKTECERQEMISWQRLFEAVEAYLSSRRLPEEPKPLAPKMPEPKLVSKSAYMSGKAAAEYLGVSDGTLAKWRCVGGGPQFVKIGHLVRYRQQDLDAFVEGKFFPHTSAYGRK